MKHRIMAYNNLSLQNFIMNFLESQIIDQISNYQVADII